MSTRTKTIGRTNFFYATFTGTFGYIAATFLFGLIMLIVIGLFIGGVMMIVKAKECHNVPSGTKMMYIKNPDGSVTPQSSSNNKYVCKNFKDLNIGNKAQFIFGCILSIVFGLILLVYMGPSILA